MNKPIFKDRNDAIDFFSEFICTNFNCSDLDKIEKGDKNFCIQCIVIKAENEGYIKECDENNDEKYKKIILDLLPIEIIKYRDDGPKGICIYPSIEESAKEIYGDKKCEIVFNLYSGRLNFNPDNSRGKNYYEHNVTLKLHHTTFIFNCRRLGICDADYYITNYIVENKKIIRLSDKNIIEKVYLELMTEINLGNKTKQLIINL
jgi:hypothetical protein